MTISKKALLKLLGDRPVAYHPMLAKALGGVIEAVFVSQLLYWYDKGKLEDNWIWKTQAEWEDETGLTRSNQETARRNLKKLGILKEQRKGVPGKIHFQLDLDRLADLLTMLDLHIVETPQSTMQESSNVQSEDSTMYNAETEQCIPENTIDHPKTTPERGAAEKTPPAPSLREQAENGEMTTETEIQVLCGYGRQGKAGVADPSQDIGQYVKFRDDVLQIFDDAGGDWGRTKKQRDARRDAIIRFANDQGDFDLECWRNTLHTSIVLGGVQPDNLACFFDVYKAGGDYQEMCSQRKNGGKPNAKNSRHSSGSGISGNRRKPAYSVADPAQFEPARTPDDP